MKLGVQLAIAYEPKKVCLKTTPYIKRFVGKSSTNQGHSLALGASLQILQCSMAIDPH